MITTTMDISKWKADQIRYFKGYLTTFERNSREYRLIREGIEKLERAR